MAGFQMHLAKSSGLPGRLDVGMREIEESELTPSSWSKQLEGRTCRLQRRETTGEAGSGGKIKNSVLDLISLR